MSIQQDKLIKIADKIRTHLGHENAIVPNSFPEEIDKVRDAAYTSGDSAGYQRGHGEGYSAGETAGYDTGFDAGKIEGYSAGETAGYSTGYSAGESAGYDTGFDAGKIEGYSAGETAGYANGYSAGESAGYDKGFASGEESGYSTGYTEGYSAGETAGYNTGFEEGKEAAENAGGKVVRGCRKATGDAHNVTISGVGFKPKEIRMYALAPMATSTWCLVSLAWKESGDFVYSFASGSNYRLYNHSSNVNVSIAVTPNNDGFQIYSPSSSSAYIMLDSDFPYFWEAFEEEQDDWTAADIT